MKKLVVLLGLVMFVATSAFAVVDPDPNSVGIYFDMEADTFCAPLTAFVQFELYVIATNSTYDTFYGFETRIDPVSNSGGKPVVISKTPVTPGASGSDLYGELMYGFTAPVSAAPAQVLCTLVMGVYDPAITSIDFYLRTVAQSSMPELGLPILLVQPTEMVNFGTSAGFDEMGELLPVAQMGDACGVVDVEGSTWGSVKSLYR